MGFLYIKKVILYEVCFMILKKNEYFLKYLRQLIAVLITVEIALTGLGSLFHKLCQNFMTPFFLIKIKWLKKILGKQKHAGPKRHVSLINRAF